jgi:BASS family bile acid:Na+ symporter
MKDMVKGILRLAESYTFILLVALAVGIGFSRQVGWISAYGRYFLGGIFFLSALRLQMSKVLGNLKDTKMLFVVNAIMLIVFPVFVFLVTDAIAPQFALAFLLLAAMPAGMTSPFLAEISGGNQGLALVLTATTSLLAPVTVPLVIKVLAGTQVAVGFWTMVLSLAKVIFVPFLLAQVVKFVWGRGAERFSKRSRPLSMALLGLLIMGIVAQRADTILASLTSARALGILLALVVLFLLHMVVGYYAVSWRSRTDRITVMICLTFMNFTLAIFLAGQYFTDPNVLVPVILSVLPWSLLLIPFRAFVGRSAAR